MVFADNMRAFSLALTDASTGEERREYVDAMGTTWVKGEKGYEFFILLKNLPSQEQLVLHSPQPPNWQLTGRNLLIEERRKTLCHML